MLDPAQRAFLDHYHDLVDRTNRLRAFIRNRRQALQEAEANGNWMAPAGVLVLDTVESILDGAKPANTEIMGCSRCGAESEIRTHA